MDYFRKHKKILGTVLLFVTLIFNLSFNFYKDNTILNFKGYPSWSYKLLLTFDGHKYDVTKKTTINVGNRIGMVCYHGIIGNFYSLYAINHIKNNEEIAIKTKQGFLIAKIKL